MYIIREEKKIEIKDKRVKGTKPLCLANVIGIPSSCNLQIKNKQTHKQTFESPRVR